MVRVGGSLPLEGQETVSLFMHLGAHHSDTSKGCRRVREDFKEGSKLFSCGE